MPNRKAVGITEKGKLALEILKAPTRKAKIAVLRKYVKKKLAVKPKTTIKPKPVVKPEPEKIFVPPPRTLKEKIIRTVDVVKQWQDYQKTGRVPKGVSIPPEIKELGKEAERAYVKASVDVSIGVKTKEQAMEELSKVMEREFKKLPPGKQEEYGYKYTEWEKIPIHERKYYPGAKKHFEEFTEEQKTEVFKEYVKTKPGLKILVDAGYKVEDWSQEMRKIVWKDVTTPWEKRKEERYRKLSWWQRTLEAGVWGFTTALVSPILIGEEIAKHVAGYEPVGAKAIAYVRAAPQGLIGGTIEEGIAKVTGGRSEAFQQMQKYPVETVFATLGEVAGFMISGKAIKTVAVTGTKHAFKTAIKTIPKVYGKIHRPSYWLKPGYKPVRIETFWEKVGKTKVWKTATGWAEGKLVRVTELPLEKIRYLGGKPSGITKEGLTFYGRITRYKGIGKPVWVPKKVAEQFRPGKFVDITYRHIAKAPGVGKTEFIRSIEMIAKPKGILFKRVSTKYLSITEKGRYGIEYFTPPSPGVTGYVKPSVTIAVKRFIPTGMKNIWRDQRATMSLVSHQTSLMRHVTSKSIGYLGRRVPSILVPTYIRGITPVLVGMFGVTQITRGLQRSMQRQTLLLPRVGLQIVKPEYVKPGYIEDVTSDVTEDIDDITSNIQANIQKTALVTIPELEQTQVYQPVTETPVTPSLKPSYTVTPKLKVPFILFPEEKKRRRKKKIIVPEDWGRFYYYREFKIPELEKVVKKVEKIVR